MASSSALRPLASTGRSRIAAARAPAVSLPRTTVRRKSGPYGYTQAKALVFSKPGEPSEALQYVHPKGRCSSLPVTDSETASTRTPSPPASRPRPSSSAPSPPRSTRQTSTPSRAPTAPSPR